MHGSLFWAELRKIWRPLPIAGMIAVCLVVSVLALSDVGPLSQPSVKQSAQILSQYGPVYTPAVAGRLQADAEKAHKAWNADIASTPGARQRGVVDEESFYLWRGKLMSQYRFDGQPGAASIPQVDRKFWNHIEMLPSFYDYSRLRDITATPSYTVASFHAALRNSAGQALSVATTTDPVKAGLHVDPAYRGMMTTVYPMKRDPLPAAVIKRVDQLATRVDSRSTLGIEIVSGAQRFSRLIFVSAVICALLLTMSTLTRDRQRRMLQLQWASKTGRAVRSVQVAAIGVSALAAGLLAAFGFVFWFLSAAWRYRDFGMFTSQKITLPWFDWTLGQYLCVVALSAGVLAVTVALLATAVFRAQSNFIRLLLFAVPLGAAGAYLGELLDGSNSGEGIYYIGNAVNKWIPVPGLEAMIIAMLTVLGVAVWLLLNHRLRHRELRYA